MITRRSLFQMLCSLPLIRSYKKAEATPIPFLPVATEDAGSVFSGVAQMNGNTFFLKHFTADLPSVNTMTIRAGLKLIKTIQLPAGKHWLTLPEFPGKDIKISFSNGNPKVSDKIWARHQGPQQFPGCSYPIIAGQFRLGDGMIAAMAFEQRKIDQDPTGELALERERILRIKDPNRVLQELRLMRDRICNPQGPAELRYSTDNPSEDV